MKTCIASDHHKAGVAVLVEALSWAQPKVGVIVMFFHERIYQRVTLVGKYFRSADPSRVLEVLHETDRFIELVNGRERGGEGNIPRPRLNMW